MIYIILFIIIIIILYFCANQFLFSKKEAFCTDKKTLNNLRKLLFTFDQIAKDNNLLYWADSGTLLGSLRHGDIIPWDDDDVVILEKDEQKLLNLKEEFKKYDIGISKFWGGYRIFFNKGDMIHSENRNWDWDDGTKEVFDYKYPFIDIFSMKYFDDENIYHYSNDKVKELYKDYYYNHDELFPLNRTSFAYFYINTPNKPHNFLNRAYGNDWKVIAYKMYDHQNMQFLDNQKFNVNDVKCE